MAAVGLGEVGAVLALEASRFSRSQADWHKLIDICALTDTLVIDHDGIYDPNDFNDRVLLGFKGTWSHTELHGMRQALTGSQTATLPKKGELRCAPPTGYVYDPEGKLWKDPDESVVAAIEKGFPTVPIAGNGIQGHALRKPNTKFPSPEGFGDQGQSALSNGAQLTESRILAILHNPTYTGTYVYGRRRSQPVIQSGQVTRVKTQQLPQSEWTVMIHDAHPAYISFEQFKANEQQLMLSSWGYDV